MTELVVTRTTEPRVDSFYSYFGFKMNELASKMILKLIEILICGPGEIFATRIISVNRTNPTYVNSLKALRAVFLSRK